MREAQRSLINHSSHGLKEAKIAPTVHGSVEQVLPTCQHRKSSRATENQDRLLFYFLERSHNMPKRQVKTCRNIRKVPFLTTSLPPTAIPPMLNLRLSLHQRPLAFKIPYPLVLLCARTPATLQLINLPPAPALILLSIRRIYVPPAHRPTTQAWLRSVS